MIARNLNVGCQRLKNQKENKNLGVYVPLRYDYSDTVAHGEIKCA